MSEGLRLRILRDGRCLMTRMLGEELVKIGRQPSCDIHLEGESVCRFHAMIERGFGDDEFSIINLGASGQTFVNGISVSRADLRAGDLITIGGYQIAVEAFAVVRGVRAVDAVEPIVNVKVDDLVAGLGSPASIQENIGEDDFVIVESEDEDLIAARIAKVLWSATAHEMTSEPTTGEAFFSELLPDDGQPVIELTERKAPAGPIPLTARRRA